MKITNIEVFTIRPPWPSGTEITRPATGMSIASPPR